jgi:hypothetical protein
LVQEPERAPYLVVPLPLARGRVPYLVAPLPLAQEPCLVVLRLVVLRLVVLRLVVLRLVLVATGVVRLLWAA